jgi:hypothetical protein
MVLTPLWGEAATTSWPRWRRMTTVFDPIRPVPPITIFMVYLLIDDWKPLSGVRIQARKFLGFDTRE